MKLFFLYTIITICFIKSNAQTANDFGKLQWLIGEWIRINAKPGMSGVEKWISNSPVELQGWGINMKGNDTTFIEKTKLVIKDNEIYYVADVAGNKAPVFFKLTSMKENGFTCENMQHDFPKKIIYLRDGNLLKATISGDGKSIDYLFEKKQ
jgi:hypothetical protein